MNINLANIDFAPGQGGGGGSLTPEEQAALDTLTNASEGVLYTKEYKKYYNLFGMSFNSSNWNQHISRMNGELYVSDGINLYNFNADTASFNLFLRTTFSLNNNPLWMDKTGRIYFGNSYQVNLETGNRVAVNLNLIDYRYNKYPFQLNIWDGKYGVYSLSNSSPQKFNEETQQFETWTINFNNGAPDLSRLATYSFEYEGHILFVDYSTMWEIKEYEDHIDVVTVNDPYFPILPIYEDGWHYVSCDAGMFHIGNYGYADNYKLENGSWNSFKFKFEDGSDDPYYVNFGGMAVGNWLVGRCVNTNASAVANLSSTIEVSYWENVKNIAVDLKTPNQHISGHKIFDAGISTPTLNNISQVNASGDLGVYNVITLKLQANNIDIQANDKFTKNNIPVVTKDELFTNDTVIPYGNMTEIVDMSSVGGVEPYYSYWFNVNNRIFHIYNGDWYEFTSNGWNQVSFSCDVQTDYIYPAGNGAYMFSPDGEGNMDLYSWDDANTDWVILQGASRMEGDVQNRNDYFYDGSVFRFRNELKLVDLGSDTYEWQQETNIPGYYPGRYVQFNGHIYCNADNQGFYEYDPLTYTYSNQLGHIGWPETGLKVMFGMIVSENYGYLKYVDFNKIDPNDESIDLNSDDYIIQLSNSGAFFGSNGVNLYCCDANGEFVKTYGVDYDIPEVPAADGTYTLKAVRSGDTVTYSWVLDV